VEELELDVTVTTDARGTAIVVAGEIDVATAPRLRAFVDGVLDLGRPGDLVLDLSGVTFMDSTGLGTLMSAARRLAFVDAQVVLRAPSRCVCRVIALTGAARFFPVEATGLPVDADEVREPSLQH
jgi:anti-sigma B factor antagonist